MGLCSKRVRRGSHTTEFAIILPIFAALVFGIIEYGYYFFQQSTVVNATQDGCREGSLYRETGITDAKTVGTDTIESNLISAGVDCTVPSRCTIDVDYAGTGETRSLQCEVTVQYLGLIGFVPAPGTHETKAVSLLELR